MFPDQLPCVCTFDCVPGIATSSDVDDETHCAVVAPSEEDVNNQIIQFSDHLESLKADRIRLEENNSLPEIYGESPERFAGTRGDIIKRATRLNTGRTR